MRFLRALAILLVALLAAAVLAAWLVPRYLDWNRYREQLTRFAASALDRPVLIEGPITLRLLPQPVLTANDVRIAGEPEQGSLSAGELSLSVALGPLLGGRLDARELVLRRVDLKLPWPVPDNAFPVRQPPWLAGLSARIEDGRIAVGKVKISHVTADLAVAGPGGGYNVSGRGDAFGHTWRLTANVGAAGADHAAPLRLTLDGDGALQGTEATFAGEVSSGGMGGRIAAHGPDLAQLLPAPKLAFSADGRLTVASGLAVADNLALLIGGAPAHGAVSLRTTPALRLDVAVTASRLDLDTWLPVLLRADGLSYPVGIDLSADAAPLAGGLVRQLRADTEIDRGTVAIRDVSAVLPGEADFRLSGRIAQPDGGPARDPLPRAGGTRFDGRVALAAPDLRATLHWLTADDSGRMTEGRGLSSVLRPLSSDLPAGVLRRLDLSAAVSMDSDRLALLGLAGTLDASRIQGDLTVGLGLLRGEPGAPGAGVRANLTTDRLDLDAWLPPALPSPAALARILSALDLDLQLRADHAAIDGIPMRSLVLDGVAQGGRLTVRRVEARALGLQANASGGIDAAGRISHARLVLTTGDAAPIGEWVAPVWRATPAFWHAPLLAWVEADGPAGAVAVNARMLLAKTDFAMQARLGPDAGGRALASFSLDDPAAADLLRRAGFADLAAAFGQGPLAARLRVGVSAAEIDVSGIDLAAGELRVGGALTVDRTGPEPRITGRLSADALPLPSFELRSPSPLPFEALRGWQALVQLAARRVLAGAPPMPLLEQAAGTLSVERGSLRLADVRARFLGGSLAGSIGLQAGSEPPMLALQAKLSGVKIPGSLTGLPLDIQGGEADGEMTLSAAGHSPATMLATLNGRAQLSVRNGALRGFDLPALDAALRTAPDGPDASQVDAALTAALSSGRTAFDRLDLGAGANRGILQLGQSDLHGPNGDATFSGSIDLPDASVDLHAAIHPALPGAPAIGLTITGPANAPRHLPDLADVTRWRNQVARAP